MSGNSSAVHTDWPLVCRAETLSSAHLGSLRMYSACSQAHPGSAAPLTRHACPLGSWKLQRAGSSVCHAAFFPTDGLHGPANCDASASAGILPRLAEQAPHAGIVPSMCVHPSLACTAALTPGRWPGCSFPCACDQPGRTMLSPCTLELTLCCLACSTPCARPTAQTSATGRSW